jgi:hypothetical protein
VILQEGRLGNASLIFPHSAMLHAKVTLPQPVTKAKALLRGFDFAYEGDDRNLQRMRVRLDLGYGDGANEVDVIATIDLGDESPVGELVQVEVLYTLIAE